MLSAFPEIKYTFPFKTLQLDDGISIAYTDEGQGERTIILIHGLSSYIPAWKRNIAELSLHFRTIAIDLPGYSKSGRGVHPGKMSFYADVIRKFILKLGLNKVTLLGHSMGGQISLTMALRYPDLIDRLVLAAPAGLEKFTEKEIGLIKRNTSPELYSSFSDHQVRKNYEANFYAMPHEAEEMVQDRILMKSSAGFMDYCRVVVNSLYGMLDEPVCENLDKIKCGTLIIFGKNDLLVPHPVLHRDLTPEILAQHAAAKIPDCELILLDKCGHFLQFEKPEEFNTSVLNFLQSQ
ncbi:MAG: alpha/beta fold hydrolase [Syntrophomonadaceae bacterium]